MRPPRPCWPSGRGSLPEAAEGAGLGQEGDGTAHRLSLEGYDRRGLYADLGGFWSIPKRIGMPKAMELMMRVWPAA